MKIVLFAYNFPHKKTQDFLFHLLAFKQSIDLVIAADAIKLNIPPHKYRYKPQHIGLIHPQQICETFNIPYFVAQHNSERVSSLLEELKPDLGIIAGARILKKNIIDPFRLGVINFHPGLIPEARGLDAMLWSVYKGIKVGVTAHFINEKIDSGRIVERQIVEVKADDTWVDLSLRIYETQLIMLDKMAAKSFSCLENMQFIDVDQTSKYNRSFPRELEDELQDIFTLRKRKIKDAIDL